MRDLTLRSAQSFGSFHLLRLLYDEYIFYLIEQRIAKSTGKTPLQMLGDVRNLTFHRSISYFSLSTARFKQWNCSGFDRIESQPSNPLN